jgi:hypothetical protein
MLNAKSGVKRGFALVVIALVTTGAVSSLTFAVDGANVWLAGRYAVKRETLNFTGLLRLRARPSQTVTGFKSFLLRLADPLFKGKNAGTELPVKVQGTVQNPKFGINVRQALAQAAF